jgi:hypothetical protein
MRNLEQIEHKQSLLNNIQINIIEQIKMSNEILLNLQLNLKEIDKEISNKQKTTQISFSQRQLNFKKDDDSVLIRKFRDKKYQMYKTEILELLLERNKKKRSNYEKDKSERNKRLYDIIKNFFIEQDSEEFLNTLNNIMK